MSNIDWLDRAASRIEEAIEASSKKSERKGLKKSLRIVRGLMDDQWQIVIDAGDRSVRESNRSPKATKS